MSADGRFDDSATDEAPLSEASESEINALVDDVLRSGQHHTSESTTPSEAPNAERLHAGVVAEQIRHLVEPKSPAATTAPEPPPEDRDEWWFELEGARLGPISVKKVRYLWEEGELSPDSLCWREGFPTWVALFRVSELADALAPKPPTSHALTKGIPLAPEDDHDEIPEWKPPVGRALESSNRERLAAAQVPARSAPPVELAPAPVASVPVTARDEHAGVFHTVAPAPDPATPPPRRSGLLNSIVGGLVAGGVISAALVGARAVWPEPTPQPTVVVIREPAPTVAPASAPAPPAPAPPQPEPRSERVQVAPPSEPRRAAPARAAAAAPAPVAATASAPVPAPAEKKPATVDDAFAQEFGPRPDELDSSEIFETVGAHKAEVEACVKAQKEADPSASGRLVMRWNVQLDGRVTDVDARSKQDAALPLATCLQKEIRTWTFPKHEVPHGPVEFPFPF